MYLFSIDCVSNIGGGGGEDTRWERGATKMN